MVVKAMQKVQLLMFESDESSSSDENEEEKELLSYAAQASSQNIRRDYLEKMFPGCSAALFENYFHMSVEAYETLEREIGPLLKSTDCSTGRPQAAIQKQILPSLWLLAKTETYRWCTQILFFLYLNYISLTKNYFIFIYILVQLKNFLEYPSFHCLEILKDLL